MMPSYVIATVRYALGIIRQRKSMEMRMSYILTLIVLRVICQRRYSNLSSPIFNDVSDVWTGSRGENLTPQLC